MSAPVPPTPPNEPARVDELVATGILDTPPDEAFEDLVALASTIVGTPTALVSLIDAEREWFKARVGLEVTETSCVDAFCAWAISDPERELLVVPDASADERFAAHPLVTGELGVRFYAGAVVRSAGGQPLGTLCAIDRAPRSGLTPGQSHQLLLLARQVGRLIELHRLGRELARSEAWARALVEGASDVLLVLDAAGTITYASDSLERIFGWSAAERTGTNALDLVHPDDLAIVAQVYSLRVEDDPEVLIPLEFRVSRRDGTWAHAEALASNRLADPDVAGVVVHVRDLSYRYEVEARVQRGERHLADAQRIARMGSWEIDVRQGTHQWSSGLYRLYGLDPRSSAPSRAMWAATFRDDERENSMAMISEAVAGGQPFSFRRYLVRADGTERMVLVKGEVERDDLDGEPVRIRATMLDIHDQVVAEAALEAEREFLETVLDTLGEGIVACDAEGNLTVFNPAARIIHGLPPALGLPSAEWADHYGLYDADGKTPLDLDDVPLMRALRTGSVQGAEIVVVRDGVAPKLLSCTGRAISGRDGGRLGAVVAMRDITAERAAEVRLRRLADHDLLTGLPNRAVFANHLDAALSRDEPIAVLFIDVDRFKAINDEHGHNVGDEVLVAVASRLTAAVKAVDTPARLGGDEFVVLLQGVADRDEADFIAARVDAALSQPVQVGGRRLLLRASVGVAMPAPGEVVDGEALLIRADHAMYEVKRNRPR